MKTAAELVKRNKGKTVDVYDVKTFMADPKIAEMLRHGRTIGCFYVGSPAMRQLLRKLRCDNYPTLVAASSVIRPGVAKSGMMRQYIERHLISTMFPFPSHVPSRPQDWYLHPSMQDYLGETYGVMVYQEDVIKVAHYFAGIDLGEADVLRRAMSGKYRSLNEFHALREKFFSNCTAKGIPESTTSEVWRQMESFAGYSFCKAHSASFAVESYQALHFKAHYPLEHMVAVMNNFGGFYRTEVYVHEARMMGGTIHAPCINSSDFLTNISGNDIYLGFILMKGFEKSIAEAVVSARKNRPYVSLADLLARVPAMGVEQATLLIRMGALRFTGKSKKTLLWEIGMYFSKAPALKQATTLFQVEEVNWQLPPLLDQSIEDAYDQMEILGFALCSPFDLTTKPPMQGEVCAADLARRHGQRVVIRGYLIATKTVKTVSNKMMGFADFIDCKGEYFDATLFPDTYSQNATPSIGVYQVTGKVADEFGIPSLEVEKIVRLHYRPDPRLG
ncbi:MAG TPA: hypothetical protein VHS96_16325 [Bacteroidia bacterium]|nr:hypothetical protein [Bacteroidia bacterium]